jgi:hypothetical protein
MKMTIQNIQSCISECRNWLDNNLSKLNDAERVEFYRLVSFVKATIYQYEQILSLKTEGVFSKIIDVQAQGQQLAIIQLERDLSSANIPIQFAYRYIRFQKKANKSYESDKPEREIQLTSILFDYCIRDRILFQITNGKYKMPPDCIGEIMHSQDL